jgi:hypothetical protein
MKILLGLIVAMFAIWYFFLRQLDETTVSTDNGSSSVLDHIAQQSGAAIMPIVIPATSGTAPALLGAPVPVSHLAPYKAFYL